MTAHSLQAERLRAVQSDASRCDAKDHADSQRAHRAWLFRACPPLGRCGAFRHHREVALHTVGADDKWMIFAERGLLRYFAFCASIFDV
jgi:hypothetical protein